MEIKKGMIFTLIMILFVPMIALAGSVTTYLDCPASANKNSEVTCTVSVQSSNTELSGIQFNYSFKGANYKSFDVDKAWSIYSNNTNGVSLGTNATKEKITVGLLKFNIGSTDANVSLVKVYGTNDAYETLNSNDVNKIIRVKSDDNNLQSLIIDGIELSPSFDSDHLAYTAVVDDESINIKAKANDNITIKGLGTFKVKYGKNEYNVLVTSESGIDKTYKITVERKDNRSNNNNIRYLKVDNNSLKVNNTTTVYNVSVEQDISKIKIEAELDDNTASFVKNYGPRTVNLQYGNNKFEIKVQAANEATKIYTINVNRKDGRSSNANIKNIVLSQGLINFNPEIDTYEISVKNNVTKVDIIPELEDSKAVFTIDNKDLEEGLNVITITVKAENGHTKVYTLNITRLKEGEDLSDNNNIRKLEIENYNINFNPNIESYNLIISKENKLIFNIEMEDENASYEILDNDNLINGSIIRIRAKSESGIIKEYKFIIEKKEDKAVNIILYIGIMVLIILIVVSLLFVFKKKKKKKVLIPEEII